MQRLPAHEVGTLFLAGGCAVAAYLLPSTDWYAPETRHLAQGLSTAWLTYRAIGLMRAFQKGTEWRTSLLWDIQAKELPYQQSLTWLPLWLRAWLARWRRPRGLFLGWAFRWDGRHTQELEAALAKSGGLPIAADIAGGHPALHAVGRAKEKPLVLPWAELDGQVLITGTTRSGKTRCLEVMTAEAMRGAGGVVIMDPKGDKQLLARCAMEARRNGRKFTLISPAFPEYSARINVLGSATTPTELSGRIRALMPSAGGRTNDPFFEEYPLALIERIAEAQKILGQRWSLEGLYPPAVFRAHMESLVAAYLAHKGYSGGRGLSQLIKHYQSSGTHDLLADALIDDLEKPRDHFQKVTSNLIPAFRGVVGEPIGPLFSAMVPNLTWKEIVDQEHVVYIAMASLLLQDTANRIGRVILQDLVGFLGRRYAYEDIADMKPITIFVDEVGDVLYPLFVNALNKGGGAKARFILAQQSLADAEAAIGIPQARRLLDNLNTKIWFRLADDRTAAEVTEGLGECTIKLPDTSVGLSLGGVGGLSGSPRRSMRTNERPMVRATWLTALPRGQAFVRMKGEVWKLRVPLLEDPARKDLDELGLTEMWDALEAKEKELSNEAENHEEIVTL